MAVVIEMPKLSDTMLEGTVLRWVKKVGDSVSAGDVVAEIQTDKAVMEMTAFDDGVLHRIYVDEGGVVPLGEPLALLLEEGEAAPADDAAPPRKSPPKSPEVAAPSHGAASRQSPRQGALPVPDSNARVKASPLARKIARQRGVDLRNLAGTGPGGRIVRKDVENAPAPSGPARTATPAIRPVMGPDDKKTPLSPMRTIIADRLLASKTQIPHFYLNLEIDAGPVLALRQQINEAGGNKFTVNDFILKAVAAAAVEVPAVNAAFDADGIVQFASVNVAVAIAIPDGLVTPVVRGAEKKSLLEISQAVKDFAERAKKLRLTPDEFQGGTITVSNLGAAGIDHFAAIINPPQAAIVSVGAAKRKPVVNDRGEIVAGDRMWLGLSCDHRVIDGAVAAQYINAIRKLLENPALMIV